MFQALTHIMVGIILMFFDGIYRNLKDFTVDTGNSGKLRSLVPDDIIFVSESGVSDAADVKRLYDVHVDAVLIGEALMRASDRKAKLAELRSLI